MWYTYTEKGLMGQISVRKDVKECANRASHYGKLSLK